MRTNKNKPQTFKSLLIKVAIALSLTLVMAIVLVFLLWYFETNSEVRGNIAIEVVKSLLQLSLIVIIGGTGIILYELVTTERLNRQQKAEQLRELRQQKAEQVLRQEQLRAEIRTSYLKRLGMLYRKAKAAKRSLRVAGLTRKFENPPQILSETQVNLYQEQMQHLNQVQLGLEALKIEASNLPTFASINQLAHELEIMDKYLSNILNEYEKICSSLDSGQSIRFSELKYLDEFTAAATHSQDQENSLTHNLKSDFANRYDYVIKLISQQLT